MTDQPQGQSTGPYPKDCVLRLAWYHTEYKVLAVTNTTAFKPGDWLKPDAVEKLCQRPNFDVQIFDDDLWEHILGFVTGAGMLAAKV